MVRENMKTYMLTIPRTCPKRALYSMLENNDCKKWVIGKETGRSGYDHWQIRVQTSNDSFFQWVKDHIPSAHVEEATDNWTYETKEGCYWGSEDLPETLKIRFGKPNKVQRRILKNLKNQNERQVDVYLDPKGNHGKTWLTVHLQQQHQALVVPRSSVTAEKLSAYICSAWDNEPIVIIDIPRATKPTKALYECIEEVKDGLVFDHRYSGKCRCIRGVKVLVFTNTPLDLKSLSADRWRLHSYDEWGDPLS